MGHISFSMARFLMAHPVKQACLALAGLMLAGTAAAGELREPPVLASSHGVLDLLMIAHQCCHLGPATVMGAHVFDELRSHCVERKGQFSTRK